jgi:hypothetical protein
MWGANFRSIFKDAEFGYGGILVVGIGKPGNPWMESIVLLNDSEEF